MDKFLGQVLASSDCGKAKDDLVLKIRVIEAVSTSEQSFCAVFSPECDFVTYLHSNLTFLH